MNTHELYVQANNLLSILLNEGSLFWRKDIRDTLGVTLTAEKTIKTVINYAVKHNIVAQDCGIRFIPGSLTTIYEKYLPDLLPSAAAKVCNILKEKKRILQIGSGRGKGIIIFSYIFLEEEMLDQHGNSIDPSDTTSLVKALKDNFTDQNNDIKALRLTVTKQDKLIQDQKSMIEELATKVQVNYKRSWS